MHVQRPFQNFFDHYLSCEYFLLILDLRNFMDRLMVELFSTWIMDWNDIDRTILNVYKFKNVSHITFVFFYVLIVNISDLLLEHRSSQNPH